MTPTLHVSSVYRTPIFTLKTPVSRAKEAYGAVYQGKTAMWWFPAFYPVHTFVLSDLKKLFPDLVLGEDAKAHIATLQTPPSIPQEFSFITPPYQHQRDGLEHLYQHLRAGLFYSPGLGKCKITVDLQRLTSDKFLILCPRVMLRTWAAQFEEHGGVTDVVVIDGYSKEKKLERVAEATDTGPSATIVTYTLASLYTDELLKIPYDVIVADESHQMKTPFAKRTQAAQALASRAYRRILLSGTPSLGSPFDMYAQLRFLGKYFCSEHWWAFRKTFGVFPAWQQNEAKPTMLVGFKNLDLMNERVNLICLRKTKEECLDLPDQTVIDIKFPLAKAQKKIYNNLITERCDAAGFEVKEGIEDATLDKTAGTELPPYVYVPEIISLLNKLNQVCSGFIYQTTQNPRLCDGCDSIHDCVKTATRPYTAACNIIQKAPKPVVQTHKANARLDELSELLESLLEDASNKVIVWANYRVELDQIENAVKGLHVKCVRVEGGMSANDLDLAQTTFNTDPEYRVYIGQVSTGIGITLNAANYTVYYNLPWSLEHYLQSLDRNYRIGQKRKVTAYRLIAEGTLDESKAIALDQKMNFSDLITTRSMCVTCPELKRCLQYNVKVYDEDCIYDSTVLRHTAQVKLIP